MAAFTSRDMPQRAAFESRLARMKADPSVLLRAVLANGVLVGSVGSWDEEGERHVCYWISRDYWGQGVATGALRLHIAELTSRPLHASIAFDNLRSRRVLEKCGFRAVGSIQSFARARGQEIEEVLFRLECGAPKNWEPVAPNSAV